MRSGSGKPEREPGESHNLPDLRPSGIHLLKAFRDSPEKESHFEDFVRQTEKIANLGVWDYDVASDESELSENLCEIMGLPSGTHMSREKYLNRVDPMDRSMILGVIDPAIAACKPYQFSSRYTHPSGAIRVHVVYGLPIRRDEGAALRVIGILRDVTEELRMEEEVHRLARQIIQMRDEERRRIAYELHESVGQTLAALKMTISQIQEDFRESSAPEKIDPLRKLLDSSDELAEAAVREVRTVAYLTHPHILDKAGLGQALRWYVRGFSERSKIRVELHISEKLARQARPVEVILFRVVQEALTNIHRYSGSPDAIVRLKQDGAHIRVEVEDHGCGIPTAAASSFTALPGIGIVGMRDRVQEFDGVFQIESTPGKGTIVRAILPVSPAVADPESRRNALEEI